MTVRGNIHVVTEGTFVPVALDEATKLIPGRRKVADGWEWGYSPEVLERLAWAGVPATEEAARLLAWTRSMPPDDPSRATATVEVPGDLPWRSRTPGREHQYRFKWWRRGGGLDRRLHHSCLLEAGKGVGKTLMAIEEMLELLERRPDPHILVLARNSNLVTVWGEQMDEHAPGVPYEVLRGTRVLRAAKLAERRPGTVYIHNHEDLPAMGDTLSALAWDLVVLDETSRFRSASAARVRLLTGASKRPLRADTKLALSGSPVIKRTVDLYPTLKWLGAPVGSKRDFADRFIIEGDHHEELAIKDLDGLLSLLGAWRFVIPKGTVMNLPRAWHYERVALKPWQRQSMVRIQADLRSQFVAPGGSIIEKAIQNHLGIELRLTQVTAGFEAIDTEHFNWRDDNAKTEHLLNNVLPDFEGEQVILWGHYRPEIDNLERLTRAAGWRPVKFYGGHGDAENEAAYLDFRDGRANLFIANTAKGAHGLNLPHAHTMVYYTRTADTESWEQSLERNARLTSDGSLLNVVVLEAEGTVDQRITRILGDDMHRASQVTSLDVAYMLGLD